MVQYTLQVGQCTEEYFRLFPPAKMYVWSLPFHRGSWKNDADTLLIRGLVFSFFDFFSQRKSVRDIYSTSLPFSEYNPVYITIHSRVLPPYPSISLSRCHVETKFALPILISDKNDKKAKTKKRHIRRTEKNIYKKETKIIGELSVFFSAFDSENTFFELFLFHIGL